MVFRTFDKIHGLAGMPIGYVLAPANALRGHCASRRAGDAESHASRLNLAAAAAALSDTGHVQLVRASIELERIKMVLTSP